jgi:hypothetical protein
VSGGVRLDESKLEWGQQAEQYMSCLENLDATRAKLRMWLAGAEAGEYDVSELWHVFRQVHDDICQDLVLLKKAEDALFEQSQVLTGLLVWP